MSCYVLLNLFDRLKSDINKQFSEEKYFEFVNMLYSSVQSKPIASPTPSYNFLISISFPETIQ